MNMWDPRYDHIFSPVFQKKGREGFLKVPSTSKMIKIQLILTGISHLFDSNGIAILRKTEKNKEKPYFIEGVYIFELR